jgi:hypothetical protein
MIKNIREQENRVEELVDDIADVLHASLINLQTLAV